MAKKFKPDPERAAEARENRRHLLAAEKSMPTGDKIELQRINLCTVEGHELSEKNHVLVCIQAAAAGLAVPSVVGGFRQWRTVGRCVCAGSRGLSIAFPRFAAADAAADNDGGNGGGSEDDGEKLAGFSWGIVFDVSQTKIIDETKWENAKMKNKTLNEIEKNQMVWADLDFQDSEIWRGAAAAQKSLAAAPVAAPVAEPVAEPVAAPVVDASRGVAVAADDLIALFGAA